MTDLSDLIYASMRELQRQADLQDAKFRELQSANEKLHRAYLRIRELIGKEAFDTPFAPSAEQIYETTEAALKKRLKDWHEA